MLMPLLALSGWAHADDDGLTKQKTTVRTNYDKLGRVVRVDPSRTKRRTAPAPEPMSAQVQIGDTKYDGISFLSNGRNDAGLQAKMDIVALKQASLKNDKNRTPDQIHQD